jgi:hypothetical protein
MSKLSSRSARCSMAKGGDSDLVDVLSDAQRCRDLVVRAAALIEQVDARASDPTASVARKEIEDFAILGIEGIAVRAGKAATLDPSRFAEAYGKFYAAIESLDRTINRIESLDEEGRLDEAKIGAAVDLIAASIASLRSRTSWFDEELGAIHVREHVETVVPASRPAQQAIQEAATVDTANIAQVAASQLTISNAYYENVLSQARRSFNSAIAAAAVGLVFFMVGVVVAVVYKIQSAAVISTLSGAIVETVAGLNFWLYARTSQQLESFHLRLERMQRYLVANSVGEGLRGKSRDAALSALMLTIATDREPIGTPADGKDADTSLSAIGARSATISHS